MLKSATTKNSMSSTTDAEKGTLLQSQLQPEHASIPKKLSNSEDGVRTNPLAALTGASGAVLPHLTINFELGVGVFARQLQRGSDGVDVPLFPDRLNTVQIDSISYLHVGGVIPVCKFPYHTSLDMHSFRVISETLFSKPFIYVDLGSALKTLKVSLVVSDIELVAGSSIPSGSKYLRINISLGDLTANSNEFQPGKAIQLSSLLQTPNSGPEKAPSSHDGPSDIHPLLVTAKTPLAGPSEEQSTAGENERHINIRQLHEMLALGDIIRKDIKKGVHLSNDIMKKLIETLKYIFKGEISKNPLELKYVVFSRFGSVIQAIATTQLSISANPVLHTQILLRARRIHATWQKRFAPRMLSVNAERLRQLRSNFGRLSFIIYDKRSKEVGSPICFATRRIAGAGFGIRNFELGHWFLNMPCVFRDGLSNSQCGTLKYGPNEIVTLPLLEGVETLQSNSSRIRYKLEGSRKKMLVHLQDKVGKEIRILRGYQLKSCLAPEVGIRYDGWYCLNGYSIKRLDDGTEKHVVELQYTRRTNQRAVEDYAETAIKPSMMDDWDVYQGLLNQTFQAQVGPLIYSLWQKTVDEEKMERREWHQNQEISRKPKVGSP